MNISELLAKPWIKYSLITIAALVLFVLIVLVLLYYAANVKPQFYKVALTVPREELVKCGQQAVVKTEDAFKNITPYRTSWETELTEDEINGYIAEELRKTGPGLLPKEIRDPRISFNNDKIDFACQIQSDMGSGVLNMNIDVRFPEENRCEITFYDAHLGIIPFSKDTICSLLADGFRKSGATVETRMDGSNPVISVAFKIGYENEYELLFREMRINDKTLSLSGSAKRKPR